MLLIGAVCSLLVRLTRPGGWEVYWLGFFSGSISQPGDYVLLTPTSTAALWHMSVGPGSRRPGAKLWWQHTGARWTLEESVLGKLLRRIHWAWSDCRI